MTSLYPTFHGVRKYEHYLSDEKITLAELLKEGGYQTAAFTDGGFVSVKFGFKQGFDIYEDREIGIAKILPRVKKWLAENKTAFFSLFTVMTFMTPIIHPHPTTLFFMIFLIVAHLCPAISFSLLLGLMVLKGFLAH